MNILISEAACGMRVATVATLLGLWMVGGFAWGAEPTQYYKITKLASGEIYQGALVANESTNLDKEIVIFDYESQKKIGPLCASNGYAWVKLDSKPDDGKFLVLNNDETKKLHNSDPGFWTVSTNTFAYVSGSEDAATVVSVVDLSDTNTFHQIKQSFGQVDSSALTHTGTATIKYSFDGSGGSTKALSVWSAAQNSERVLGSVTVQPGLDKEAFSQFRTAVKE
jgi:hypothetical protein